MKTTRNMRATVAHGQLSMEWETFEQFVADIAEARKAGERMSAGGWRGNIDWYGCAGGVPEVFNKVEYGWPEMRGKLERLTADLELEIPNFPSRAALRRRKRHRDDHGDTLDMTRVWNGDIGRAWERPVREDVHTVSTKRVTMALDLGTPWHMTQEAALWRAALAVALCDRLARAGKVIEVWVCGSAMSVWRNAPIGSNNKSTSAWCIKRTQDPLVLDRLCSMVTAGFWRACGFWSFHTLLDGRTLEHYGYYPGGHEQLPATLEERRAGGELVLHTRNCLSKEQMLAEYERAWKEVEAHAAIAHQEHVA
jgi:hypothetical protein